MRTMIFVMVVLFTSIAHGAKLKSGNWACHTESQFQEMMMVSAGKDRRGIAYMLKHGCFAVPGGVQASILRVSAHGAMKIVAYTGDKTSIMWVHRQALSDIMK